MNEYKLFVPTNSELIGSEVATPLPFEQGYSGMSGIFRMQKHDEGWEKITSAVHNDGGKIFVLLMHKGRINHTLNMPEGAQILDPSAVKAIELICDDSKIMHDFLVPTEMTRDDLIHTKIEFVDAAKNALVEGYDGVELDASNGLLEQFLSPKSNSRSDNYGGSLENRCGFVIDVIKDIAAAIGKEKTAICLSPYSPNNNMTKNPEIQSTIIYLAEQLNNIGIAFIHLVDYSSIDSSATLLELQKQMKSIFKNSILITNVNNDKMKDAENQNDIVDNVSFGRPFIYIPEAAERFENDWSITQDLKTNLFRPDGKKDEPDFFKGQ